MQSGPPEKWVGLFKEKYGLFEAFTERLEDLFRDLLQNIDVVQIDSRTKTIDSFTGKLQREGKNYNNPIEEITDLVGIRIICYYLEDVDKVGNIIKEEFDLDLENSIDKSQTLDPDKFGYLSVHYIISLGNNRKQLREWKEFDGLKAEIQIKTVLQHAWAAIDHKLRYKSAIEVPKDLRRKLFRLSALLELADEGFLELKNLTTNIEKRYENEVKRGDLNVDINLLSLEAYFKSTHILDNFIKIAKKSDYNIIGIDLIYKDFDKLSEMTTKLINTLNLLGINKIKEFDYILNNKIENPNKIFDLFRKQFEKYNITNEISPTGIILLLILYIFKEEITDEKLKEMGFEETSFEIIKGAILS